MSDGQKEETGTPETPENSDETYHPKKIELPSVKLPELPDVATIKIPDDKPNTIKDKIEHEEEPIDIWLDLALSNFTHCNRFPLDVGM